MQSTYPTINSVSDLATGNGNDVPPFSQQSVVLTKQAYIELTWEANYWRAQHTRLLEREAALKAEVETLHATIRDLKLTSSGRTRALARCLPWSRRCILAPHHGHAASIFPAKCGRTDSDINDGFIDQPLFTAHRAALELFLRWRAKGFVQPRLWERLVGLATQTSLSV